MNITKFKFLIAIFVAFFATFNVYSSDEWTLVGSVSQPGLTPSIGAGTTEDVWIVGGSGTNPKIFKSENGGYNWNSVSTNGIGNELNCVAGFNKFVAFIGEGVVNGGAKLLKTTDGGATWNVVLETSPNGGYFTGIAFTKARSNLFGLAIAERIYRSSNSGVNWIELNPGTVGVSNAQNSLMIVDNYFYGFGLNNGAARVRLTTDNSASWSTQHLSVSGNYTSAIAFHSNKLLGVAATSTSMPFISRTTDGGASWTNVDIGPGLTGNCYVNWIADGPVIYIMGENGGIKRSTDNGLNWVSMYTAGVNNLKHFDFVQYTNIVYGWAVALDGRVIKLVDTLAVLTGVNSNNNIPGSFSLEQNYPNPFNPTSLIEFSLPKESFVKLSVYDALGREIDVLVNENRKPGIYQALFDGSDFNSGVYFYQLQAGEFTQTKKMILVK
jgi:photosystem II stability/assembly factor-like uncharacterized protein